MDGDLKDFLKENKLGVLTDQLTEDDLELSDWIEMTDTDIQEMLDAWENDDIQLNHKIKFKARLNKHKQQLNNQQYLMQIPNLNDFCKDNGLKIFKELNEIELTIEDWINISENDMDTLLKNCKKIKVPHKKKFKARLKKLKGLLEESLKDLPKEDVKQNKVPDEIQEDNKKPQNKHEIGIYIYICTFICLFMNYFTCFY